MKEKYLTDFNQLIELHNKTNAIHPALAKLYPVALADEEALSIYDFDPQADCYQFIKRCPLPMPIPLGVRAAFQIEAYGGRISCVVTPDIFTTREGFITILHEFVHCYQYETCEQALKIGLDVAQKAHEVGDFMWEIDHPFPYNSTNFIEGYYYFLQALEDGDSIKVLQARHVLKTYLGVHDFEYMVWQEWKEGFARWVENKIKYQLGVPENTGGLSQPYSRVLFYAGGERYIRFLEGEDRSMVLDLPKLFHSMMRVNLNHSKQ